MKSLALVSVALGVAVICLPSAAVAADAQQAVTKYRNCTALNKVYRHGVGRPNAHDKTSGTPVRNFTKNTRVYNANTARDRDKDGIACEKR